MSSTTAYTGFSFDYNLLESCAVQIEDEEVIREEEAEEETITSASTARARATTNSRRNSNKVIIPNKASSKNQNDDIQSMIEITRETSASSSSSSSSSSCQELYEAYRSHFYDTDNIDPQILEERYHKFQETVKLIYNHNNNNNNNNNVYYYKLTLNRFADQLNPPLVLPFEEEEDEEHHDTEKDYEYFDVWTNQLRSRIRRRRLLDGTFNSTDGDDDDDDDDDEREITSNFIPLDEEWKIRSIYSTSQQQQQQQQQDHRTLSNLKHQKKKHKKKTSSRSTSSSPPLLSWHHYVNNEPFNVVNLPKRGMGVEMDLKPTNHFSTLKQQQHYFDTYNNTDGGGGGEEEETTVDDKYAKSLNWATKHNPDKVPLVHDVFDQGDCGSCWAYAATGSLETSVARRAAHEYYTKLLEEQEKMQQQQNVNNTGYHRRKHIRRKNKAAARQVEFETFLNSKLSIQELIDCDIVADQGCVGGNPLLSFYYIKKYGLVPWEEYEYTGTKGACQLSKINKPIVTVDSWGSLPKDHEDMIELAVRYIGPVAVAINAADPTFIAYDGGIYDNPICSQKANHALLIVGYGEEKSSSLSDSVVRYWIARNSWSKGWGENGFIRIKRGPGGPKMKGVCGIARSPSVALGGTYHPNRIILDDLEDPTTIENLDYSKVEPPAPPSKESRLCDFAFDQDGIAHLECIELSILFNKHKAASLGAFSVVLAFLCAVVPLSIQCCLRRRRRQQLRRDSSGSIGPSLQRRLSSLSGSDFVDILSSVDDSTLSETVKDDKEPLVNGGCNGREFNGVDERTPILNGHEEGKEEINHYRSIGE